MGGRGFEVFEPNQNYVRVYLPKREFGPAEWRRAIYAHTVRMEKDATFGVFDCPDGGRAAPRRARSTNALQALSLLNSPFIVQQAELFAERIERDAAGSTVEQIQRAFSLAFQRPPDGPELAAAVALVDTHGLPALCRALLNASEFLFVS